MPLSPEPLSPEPLSSRLVVPSSEVPRPESVPSVWAERFGASRTRRYALAAAGGFILIFGARMAGGCTSGHGISGGLQLAVSSWVFFAAMFASGVLTAAILFRGGARHA